jgi:broad specificity phosphatase PhoE
MTRLCLVRHGQTDWNLEGRYQGQSDNPINETGKSQARGLADRLKSYPFSALYSSDLERAKETAQIISSVIPLSITYDSRLREINQGEWEGQFVDDIRARYAALWQQRSLDPASLRPPGGETIGEVAKRVYASLDDISRLHPVASPLVVTHGLVIASVICKGHGIPLGKAYGFIPENAEPVWMDWESGKVDSTVG